LIRDVDLTIVNAWLELLRNPTELLRIDSAGTLWSTGGRRQERDFQKYSVSSPWRVCPVMVIDDPIAVETKLVVERN